ncbi:MAG: FkbM family methyltransferase [Flavobacterium sp.]|nr:MAG: FkbM family methyltransferase [Flavobacterium sp.]
MKKGNSLAKQQPTNESGKTAPDDDDALLKRMGRYKKAIVKFCDKNIQIVDSASYLFTKIEIFDLQIYNFTCDSPRPYIVDCGANIGLSVIYFKQLFPDAEILAFEPDENVFQALQHNIQVFEFLKVELINKACWNAETTLKFYSEGADGGRAAKDFDNVNIVEVGAVRLRNYISRKIDFLKIDIEGAENEVLHDIQDLLFHVDKVFVEFHSFVGKEQMLPEIFTILKNAGFRLHISSPGLKSQSPFISVNVYENMDNQLNIYGFRE